MSLFDEPIRYTLTPDEHAIVTRPVVGDGGAQIFLRTLLDSYDVSKRTGLIEIVQLQTTMEYAYAFGGGGFQQRFRVFLDAAQRAGWDRPAPPPSSTGGGRQWNG